jgi:hypothetical protein
MPDYFDPVTNRQVRGSLVAYKRSFILSPNQWLTLNGAYKHFNWIEVKFTETNRNTLPQVEGLYFFTASPKRTNSGFLNYLFYVGETQDINQRYSDYLDKVDNPKSGQYKVYTIIEDFPDDLYFHYVQIPGCDRTHRRIIEDAFLIGYIPPINTKYPQGLQSIVLAAYGQ